MTPRKPSQRFFRALALEPRILLDAAAVATAAQVAAQVEATKPDDTKDSKVAAISSASDHSQSARSALDEQSPVLGADTGVLEIAEQVKSDNWPDPYKGLQGVVSVGDLVYAVRDTTDWVYDPATATGADVRISTLYTFQRNADGTLSLRDTLEANAQNHLLGAWAITASRDGSTLLVRNADGVAVFARDAATGTLSARGNLAGVGLINDALVNGDSLYLSTGDALRTYQRQGDAWVERPSQVATAQVRQFNALQLSSDGQLLFAGTSGDSSLASVYRVASDGSLAYLAEARGAGEHFVNSISLSADGKTLYALDNGTSLQRLTVASDGSLTLSGTPIKVSEGAKQVIVSQDGKAVTVIGKNRLELFTQNDSGELKLSHSLTIGTMDEVRSATLSSDGQRLYLSGQFSWKDSLLVVDLKAARSTFTEGGEAVAVLPGGTLADLQLDALGSGAGDYNGARITLTREGGANAEDQFSFLDSDTLKRSGNQLFLNGTAVASFVENTGTLTLTFIGTIAKADAQRVLRGIAYSNSSQDPAAKVNLRMTLDDGTGNSSNRTVELDLVGVNNPAKLETTLLNPRFQAEGEPVRLFDKTRIDTVEAGQFLWYVSLTFDKVRPGDVLGVGNGYIALDAKPGVSTTATGQQYNLISNADGSTTVWIYMNQVPIAEVNAMIDSLAFGHVGNDTSGQRTITLGVQELDSDNQATSLNEKLVVTLEPAPAPNTAPTLGDLSTTLPYTEQAAPIRLAPGATLSDAQMDAFAGGSGNYSGATLTISLTGGKTAADSLGFLAENGLSLVEGNLQKNGTTIGQLSVADGVMTIRFSDAHGLKPSASDVRDTLRQITYANSSEDPPASVGVTIRLADQRGLTVEHALTVAITAINDAPSLSQDAVLSLGELKYLQGLPSIPGLAVASSSVVSNDGSHVYVADKQGNIALLNRNPATGELSHVKTLPGSLEVIRLQLSADGNSLYALQQNGSSNTVSWFTVEADGNLRQQGSFSDSIWNIKDFTLSADGKNLYLIHPSSLYIFNRDTVTGAISLASTLEGNMNAAPYLWEAREIVSRGELVYVVTNATNGSTLIVYRRDAQGGLSLLANIHSGNTDATGKPIELNNVQQLAVSADGRTIFVANGQTISANDWTGQTTINNHPQQVDAFRLDPASGSLTHLGTLRDTVTVKDIAISNDGKALFVSRDDGSLAYYSVGALAKMSTSQTGLIGAGHISISADGALIVSGDSLHTLDLKAIPVPTTELGGTAVALAPALLLNDPELDAGNDYRGAKVSFTGAPGDRFGLLANGTYSLDGDKILRDGNSIATLVQSGDNAVLTFTAQLTRDDANALLRQVSYTNTSGSVGEHSVTLVLNDGELNSASQSILVKLLPANQAPEVTNTTYALAIAKAGQAYQATLPADLFIDPEGASLSWSVTGLPAGLRFDPLTRSIVGTLSSIGEHPIRVTVADPKGASTALDLTLHVENSAPEIGVAHDLKQAISGQPYRAVLPAELFSDANDSTLDWALSLPDWLSYDASTRTLSGIAPQDPGRYTVTITASDAQGASVSRNLSLNVAQAAVPSVSVLPQLNSISTPTIVPMPASPLGAPALDAPLFESAERISGNSADPVPLTQSPPITQNLLRSATGTGLADGRGSLSEQLANSDGVLTDSGLPATASSSSFDGTTLRSDVDLNQNPASRSIELRLPVATADGASAQRVTLANGLPLPSWASFDARTGDLRIDRERLQRDGVLRLTLISRDAEGKEQRTPVEVRATQAPANAERAAPQVPTAQVESLPERLRQDTSSALLSEALDLLDQLSDLAAEPAAATRHIA